MSTRVAGNGLGRVVEESGRTTNGVLYALLRTGDDRVALVLRATLALVMFPHGAQKLLGWFGGPGFSGTMGHLTVEYGLPVVIAVLVIVIEFFGPLALAVGVGRGGSPAAPLAGRSRPPGGRSRGRAGHRRRHGGRRADTARAQWLLHELVRQSGRRGVRVSPAGGGACCRAGRARQRGVVTGSSSGPAAGRVSQGPPGSPVSTYAFRRRSWCPITAVTGGANASKPTSV